MMDIRQIDFCASTNLLGSLSSQIVLSEILFILSLSLLKNRALFTIIIYVIKTLKSFSERTMFKIYTSNVTTLNPAKI